MKKLILFSLLILQVMMADAQTKVSRVDPTDWFVGMKDPTVQLMVFGKNIGTTEFSTDYPGVTVDSIVRLDSPNYLLVYLNLKNARPGEMTLCFKDGKKTLKWKYRLKERVMKGEDHIGFTNRGCALYAHARPFRERQSEERPHQGTARSACRPQ